MAQRVEAQKQVIVGFPARKFNLKWLMISLILACMIGGSVGGYFALNKVTPAPQSAPVQPAPPLFPAPQSVPQLIPAPSPLIPAPTPESWLTIRLPVPREIRQANYYQAVDKLAVTCNVPPSAITNLTDSYGNVCKEVSWNERQAGKVVATLETTISRKVGRDPISTSDPYPVPTNLIPDEAKLYLKPSLLIQSDSPLIKARARTISQNFVKEVDVVNGTLAWISQNIKWGCPTDIEGYADDALWTLEHRKGNCVNFANLTIALLRAQGIPARLASGLKGYEDSNPGYLKLVEDSNGHAWTEAYYPEVGWVRYDATYFEHPWYITYGIQMKVFPDATDEGYSRWSGKARGELSDNWQLVGLGDNKVKLTYTITFSVKG